MFNASFSIGLSGPMDPIPSSRLKKRPRRLRSPHSTSPNLEPILKHPNISTTPSPFSFPDLNNPLPSGSGVRIIQFQSSANQSLGGSPVSRNLDAQSSSIDMNIQVSHPAPSNVAVRVDQRLSDLDLQLEIDKTIEVGSCIVIELNDFRDQKEAYKRGED
ncbi:hypothetical protein R6Q59_024711 [Mikania micrantha]